MRLYLITQILSMFICVFPSHSQYVEGIILDKTTKKTLAGASVKIQNRGLISNNKGEFRINIKGVNSFKISYIGYKTVEIPISKLEVYYTIELEESNSNLQEVIVSSSARNIVNKAFQQIQNNYLQQNFTTKGFLAESNRFDKEHYIYSVETFLKTKTYAYDTDKSPDIEILQKKSKYYYNLDTLRFVRWGGTPRLLDYYDFVRTKKSFINPDKNTKYKYTLLDIKPFDGQDVYVIAFESKNGKEKGTLWIDYESLAFVGTTYKYINDSETAMKADSGGSFEVKVMYRKLNNKWFLDYMNFDKIVIFKSLFSKKEDVKSELHLDYKCTEIDTTKNITKSDIDYISNIQRMDILLENKVLYDSTFWSNNAKKEGSIDLDFERFTQKRDSIKIHEISTENHVQQLHFRHKIKKYLRNNVHFEYSLGTLFGGISENYINLNYVASNNSFFAQQTKKINSYNQYGFSLGWSFQMPYKTRLLYQSIYNLPFAGLSQNCSSITFQKHFTIPIKQRAFAIIPFVGIDFWKIAKTFDDTDISLETIQMYELEGNNVCPTLSKRYTNLASGVRLSFEISRRKSVFFNLKYSHILSEKNDLKLTENHGFFLFRSSYTIRQIPETSNINNQTYPLTFHIGLIF